MIARDGEGATKLVEVTVSGAESVEDADAAAREIANSPLVKTAVFGNDPNWGRIIMALGQLGGAHRSRPSRCHDRRRADMQGRHGRGVRSRSSGRGLGEKDVAIDVELHQGEASATVWTCDFSYDYVRINAEYTT